MYSYQPTHSSSDIQISDLKTQKKDTHLLLNTIITKLEQQGIVQWDPQDHNMLKGLKKSIESDSTRSKLEERLLIYKSPEHTIQSLKMSNQAFHTEEANLRIRRGQDPLYQGKVDNMLTILRDGKSTGFLHHEKRSILLRYESLIQRNMFDGCAQSFSDLNNKQIVQPIQSLLSYLDRSEEKE